MKKVVSILGSPRRNGTSSRVAASFTEEAQRLGADIESFNLNSMEYRGCQGCEICHTKLDHCVLNDEGTKVLDSMRTADVLVLSSPVYWGDMTGQFKLLMDRIWSHFDIDYSKDDPYASRIPQGKTVVLVLSQENDDSAHKDVVERYNEMFSMFGFDVKVIRATNLSMAEKQHDVSVAQTEALELAKKIFKASNE